MKYTANMADNDDSNELFKMDDAYKEDNGINLSDLDEDQKKELVELEKQIERDDLTRGERRRLQNKRNVLKAKIKKDLETEGHKNKIFRLQKKVML